MFERYDKQTKRRIYSLLSRELDSNVKLGINDPQKITENFIREISSKKLETWESLQTLIDEKYFYNECINYVKDKIQEYEERYKETFEKGKISVKQVKYLGRLIEKGLRSKNYKLRMKSLEELNNILSLLSKSSASYYINKYDNLLKDFESTQNIDKQS